MSISCNKNNRFWRRVFILVYFISAVTFSLLMLMCFFTDICFWRNKYLQYLDKITNTCIRCCRMLITLAYIDSGTGIHFVNWIIEVEAIKLTKHVEKNLISLDPCVNANVAVPSDYSIMLTKCTEWKPCFSQLVIRSHLMPSYSF